MDGAMFRHHRRDDAFQEWPAAVIPPSLLTELQTTAVEREETLPRLIEEILQTFAAERRLKRLPPHPGPGALLPDGQGTTGATDPFPWPETVYNVYKIHAR